MASDRVKHSGPDTKFCVLCLSGEHERVEDESRVEVPARPPLALPIHIIRDDEIGSSLPFEDEVPCTTCSHPKGVNEPPLPGCIDECEWRSGSACRHPYRPAGLA